MTLTGREVADVVARFPTGDIGDLADDEACRQSTETSALLRRVKAVLAEVLPEELGVVELWDQEGGLTRDLEISSSRIHAHLVLSCVAPYYTLGWNIVRGRLDVTASRRPPDDQWRALEPVLRDRFAADLGLRYLPLDGPVLGTVLPTLRMGVLPDPVRLQDALFYTESAPV